MRASNKHWHHLWNVICKTEQRRNGAAFVWLRFAFSAVIGYNNL